MTAEPRCSFTVVVPTRDRPDSLARCLQALDQQTVTDFEIVVVDDGSVDAATVAATVGQHERARLVRAGGHGPAKARNLGAEAATAGIVCFTDDDCRPRPTWLAALQQRFESGADVVAGSTVNGQRDDPWSAASQLVTNHLMLWPLADGIVSFAPTSNIACRSAVFALHRFDETFPLAAGEDRAWCTSLTKAGIDIHYEPDAIVEHHQELSACRFWRQQRNYGRGAVLHRSTSDEGLQPARFYSDLVRSGFRGGFRVLSLVLLAQLATVSGVLAERLRR